MIAGEQVTKKVKTSLAVTHKSGLITRARTFPGNPYDGHVLSAQLEQTVILLEDSGVRPTQAVVNLGYRCVDADSAGCRDPAPWPLEIDDPAIASLCEPATGDRADHQPSES